MNFCVVKLRDRYGISENMLDHPLSTLQWNVSATIQAGPGECELAPPRPVLAIIKVANEYAEL